MTASGVKKKKRQSPAWVSGTQGWKAVDVAGDILLGAEEGGFAGLEVLDDINLLTDLDLAGGEIIEEVPSAAAGQKKPKLKKQDKGTAGASTDAGAASDEPQAPDAAQHPASNKRKTAGVEATAAGQAAGAGGDEQGALQGEGVITAADPSDMQALQAQLESLKRENARLKAAATGSGPGPDEASKGTDATPAGDSTAGKPLSAGALKRKQKLEAYKAKMTARREERKKKQKEKRVKGKQGAAGSSGNHAAGEGKQGTGAQSGAQGGAAGKGAGGKEGGTEGEGGAGQEGAALADVSAWRPFGLHPLLEKGLSILGFTTPTEIQAQVLPAALRDRLDVIGAAQTGSGKTLAFGLPILQTLLEEREVLEASGEPSPHADKLRALILTPTRELALQVTNHISALSKGAGIRVVAIVGGLAHVKQERLLRSKPSVVVATPGRLWELLREQASPHLSDMSGLRFLVLDEADRMVAKGHFQELSSILSLVPHPATGLQKVTYDTDFNTTLAAVTELEKKREQKQQEKREKGGGKRGRGKGDAGGEDSDADMSDEDEDPGLHEGSDDPSADDMDTDDNTDPMSDDPMSDDEISDDEMSDQDDHTNGEGSEDPTDHDHDTQKAHAQHSEGAGAAAAGDHTAGPHGGGKGGKRGGKGGGAFIQTMVFSATLTLPAALRKRLKKGGGGALGGTDLDNLMDRVPFRGSPRIVDLSTSGRRLAEGVTESVINCLSGTDRDANLYYLLVKHSGRTLVFVNAVSALRRVAALLKTLGLPAHALHAQQQQRQRLKALDAFKSNDQSVLVATDVAARGLDVKDVRMVIHYQLPASVDTYIHRSGRTARGAGREGLSVALVAPDESAKWRLLIKAMGNEDKPPSSFPVDATLMPKVVERMKFALHIDATERAARKAAANTSWEARAARDAGLLGSDDSDAPDHSDDDDAGSKKKRGKKRSRQSESGKQLHHKGGGVAQGDDDDDAALTAARMRARQAAELSSLKHQLSLLVAQPLVPRMSKAFFTGGATAGVAVSSAATRGGPALADGAATAAAAAAAVPQAIANALRIHGSNTATAAATAGKKNKKNKGKATNTGPAAGVASNGVSKGVVKGATPAQRGGKRLSVEELARKELLRRTAVKTAKRAGGSGAAAAAAAKAGTGGGRRRGLVVIPASSSRDVQGPDALTALKRKLAALG